MSERILFIINPKAGQIRIRESLFDVLRTVTGSGATVSVCMTEYRGHASELVREHAMHYDRVLVAGGDGTLSEVITGLRITGLNLPVGYIPAGSTNDFGTALGLPKNMVKAAEVAMTGEERLLDIGTLAGRCFIYIAAFGAFSGTSSHTPQDMKNALGHLAYVLQGISDLGSIHAEDVRIETDRGTVYEGRYIFGALANTTSIGGVLSLDKTAVMMDDGRHELLLVREPKNPAELSGCVTALMAKNYRHPMIVLDSVSSATVTSHSPLDWSLDGESFRTEGDALFVNLRRGVRFLLPKAEKPEK